MKQYSPFRSCVVALLLIAGLYGTGRAVSQNATLFSMMIYAQTGRVIPTPTQPQPSEPTNFTSPTQTTQPSEPAKAPEAVVSFSGEEALLFDINYLCTYRPDVAGLLRAPLEWDLADGQPRVLIVHTHATESYTGDYIPVEPYRSLEDSENMLAIGDEVARVLEMGGVQVIHDRTLHDYPDYNSAYANARRTIADYLEEYPSICMVLDLHRDAAGGDDYGDLVTAATVDGQKSAQLLFVVGSDAGGAEYPHWQKNFALALKLNALLEQEDPGITRPVSLRGKRYNLDLTAGSLLVEVGAAGNTKQEAIIAANALARAILALANGSG